MATLTTRLWSTLTRRKPRRERAEPLTAETPKSARDTPAGQAAPCRSPLPLPKSDPRGSGKDSIWVTVLVENSVDGRDLQAEHGLAFHVGTDHGHLLFDTGQTDLLLRNAAVLGLRLDAVQAIALSHGHYDHTGGLDAVRQVARQARVFLHPDAVNAKFSGQPDGSARPVGMAGETTRKLQQAQAPVTWTRQPTEVLDGVFVTGEIPRGTAFEDTGGRFFLDEECARPDRLLDDQAVFFDTADGVVVLLGCAHAGVINTLRRIRDLTAGRPIHAVLGGFHLLAASEDRLGQTLTGLEELGVKVIGVAHCTGQTATARLWTTFPNRCCTCAVGSRFVFRR